MSYVTLDRTPEEKKGKKVKLRNLNNNIQRSDNNNILILVH